MANIEFDFHWESGEGIAAPELRETMASLRISVGGETVTRVEDGVSRSVRDVVRVPLYPIAEWIAANWFTLLFECPGPGRTGFDKRHMLSSGREGFAIPALSIVPEGEWINLSWRNGHVPHSDLTFISSGDVRISREEVIGGLASFVASVVARLQNASLEGITFLEEEWNAINALGPEEQPLCEAAGALGLDPFSTTEEQDARIAAAAGQLPMSVLSEFFAAALWARFDEDVAWVRSALAAVPDRGEGVALADLRQQIREGIHSQVSPAPWEKGYRCAREVRQELGCDGLPLRTEDLQRLGWDGARDILTCSDVFDALASMDQLTQAGMFAVSGRHLPSRRFAFARALFEYLTAEQFPRVVTRATTYSQKESRAFAAELLAPAQSLREHITGDTVSPEQVEELAEAFTVSSMVIEHQVVNHKIAVLRY